jgi:murein DD-endopeptidase MepM/ murein hydrolase activator NlpD
MKPPISLLIFHSDGRGVSRVHIPRWVVYATLGMIAAVATYVVGLSGERVLLDRQWTQLAALRQRSDDQRAMLEAFQSRAAAIRGEIRQWEAVHARIRSTFDPSVDERPINLTERPDETPRAGDQLGLLATTVAEEGPRLRELEHVLDRTGKLVSTLPLRWPVRGGIKSSFGMRKSPWTGAPEFHPGMDIGSPPGTPIHAPAAGRVVSASSGGGYGKHIVLDHGARVKTRYGHLERLNVRVGQHVERGDVIGLVGSTGRSTGPHLHYEVLVDGQRVNPRGFLVSTGAQPAMSSQQASSLEAFSPSDGFARVCAAR